MKDERKGARPCASTGEPFSAEEPLDETLSALVREYHAPGDVPVEAMWQAIQDKRSGPAAHPGDETGRQGTRVLTFRRAVRVALPVAAVLVVGIFIGRMSQGPVAGHGTRDAGPQPTADGAVDLSPRAQRGDEGPNQAMASSAAPRPQSDTSPVTRDPGLVTDDRRPTTATTVFSVAAERHFAQAESFLTLFRASVEEGKSERLAPATARELLMSNRLLMDSPAANDPKVERLLSDIELVLAQIAQLPAEGQRADAQIITDGLKAGGILTRIRSEVTSGPVAAVPQGAL